jgi:CYTH domain-containing protein
MALEIERKFLLKELPDIMYDNKLNIMQWYCDKNLRIRRTLDVNSSKLSYTVTKKTLLRPGVYEEDEQVISKKKYEALLKSAFKCIIKTRYIKKFGKLKWEIDSYKDMSLTVAEIELPKEGHKFKLPDYIAYCLILEVTHMPEFTNKNLAFPIS